MSVRIRSLSASSGYLQKAPIRLADGLTCIIGARGTCKSTIVETIRFAFNCDPKRIDNLLLAEAKRPQSQDSLSHRGMIRETLKEGNVCCELEEDDATGPSRLTIERDVSSRPRIYRDGI